MQKQEAREGGIVGGDLPGEFGHDWLPSARTTVVRSHGASPGSATNLPCDLWPITFHSEPQLLKIRLDKTSDFQKTFGAPCHLEISPRKHCCRGRMRLWNSNFILSFLL